MIYVLLEGLAARAQMEKFYNLFMHKFSFYPDMAEMARKVKNAFVDGLVPIRNSLSHGLMWPSQPASPFPDPADFEDLTEALTYDHLDYQLFSLEHHKVSSKGFNRNKLVLSINDLKDFNRRMEHFRKCFFILRHFHEYKNMKEEREESLDKIATEIKELRFVFNPLPNYWDHDEL